jgi:hypothetical protein
MYKWWLMPRIGMSAVFESGFLVVFLNSRFLVGVWIVAVVGYVFCIVMRFV